MENIKYILIVSQYYYSYYCIIVSAEEKNYREKALAFVEKLEDYKRSNGINVYIPMEQIEITFIRKLISVGTLMTLVETFTSSLVNR